MKLYYTIISQEGIMQNEPSQSLGGFKSASVVPNNYQGNLFPDITNYSLQKNLPEYIGLILQNTLPTTYNVLRFRINSPTTSICNYRVAVVELTNGEMEGIPNRNSRPFIADFYEVSQEDPIEINGAFEKGQALGIWIERSFKEVPKDLLYDPNEDHIEICNLVIDFE